MGVYHRVSRPRTVQTVGMRSSDGDCDPRRAVGTRPRAQPMSVASSQSSGSRVRSAWTTDGGARFGSSVVEPVALDGDGDAESRGRVTRWRTLRSRSRPSRPSSPADRHTHSADLRPYRPTRLGPGVLEAVAGDPMGHDSELRRDRPPDRFAAGRSGGRRCRRAQPCQPARSRAIASSPRTGRSADTAAMRGAAVTIGSRSSARCSPARAFDYETMPTLRARDRAASGRPR